MGVYTTSPTHTRCQRFDTSATIQRRRFAFVRAAGLSLCTRAFRESDDVAVEATAGDVLYHLGTTVHRANANTSAQPRRVIGILAIVSSHCKKDPILEEEAKVRLQEDIDLQQFNDFELYKKLIANPPTL